MMDTFEKVVFWSVGIILTGLIVGLILTVNNKVNELKLAELNLGSYELNHKTGQVEFVYKEIKEDAKDIQK